MIVTSRTGAQHQTAATACRTVTLNGVLLAGRASSSASAPSSPCPVTQSTDRGGGERGTATGRQQHHSRPTGGSSTAMGAARLTCLRLQGRGCSSGCIQGIRGRSSRAQPCSASPPASQGSVRLPHCSCLRCHAHHGEPLRLPCFIQMLEHCVWFQTLFGAATELALGGLFCVTVQQSASACILFLQGGRC
jgi:hypothetical protein